MNLDDMLNNLSVDECKSSLSRADNEGYVHIIGFGKVHKSYYEQRIEQLNKQ